MRKIRLVPGRDLPLIGVTTSEVRVPDHVEPLPQSDPRRAEMALGMKYLVAVELAVISYIRHRFMDTPFLQATFQVVVGGVLVFLAGILIGSS